MKKSEEIPSRCLGTNSYQGIGDEGLASTCQGKGAPQLHRRCQRHPLNPTRCPAPLTGGPSGPDWPEPRASESQRVAAHPGQGLLCPPPPLTPHPAPLPGTRPLPPPRRPGLGPVPRVQAFPGPEACPDSPGARAPDPRPHPVGHLPPEAAGTARRQAGRFAALAPGVSHGARRRQQRSSAAAAVAAAGPGPRSKEAAAAAATAGGSGRGKGEGAGARAGASPGLRAGIPGRSAGGGPHHSAGGYGGAGGGAEKREGSGGGGA